MRGVNKVIIVGNLGADPEHRQFDNGGSVTNISVATSERWNDKITGELREQTEWHRISLYNRLGEIAAQYLRKGSSVYIEGSLRTRKYQDQNGQDRYITEIRADNMQMLGGNTNNNNMGNPYDGGYQGANVFNNPNQPNSQTGFNPQNTQNQQMGYQNPAYANQSTPPQQGYMQGNPQQNMNGQNNSFANNSHQNANQYTNNNVGQSDNAGTGNTQDNKTNTMPTSAPVDDDIPF